MRIAAVLSGDENLKYAFTDLGGDVHSLTACSIFHPDMDPREFMKHKKEHPYKEQRAIAKTVNFQFLFGGSAWSFAEDILKLQWSKQYCTDFLVGAGLDPENPEPYQLAADFLRNSYFASYPKLAEWHEKSHQIARRDGMVQSVFGARRLLPRLLYIGRDTPKREISDDQNVSKNTVVQNFEATAIMRGMRAYYEFAKENNLKSKIFGMIHDAVEFYIYREERDIVVPKILEIFQRDFPEYQGVNMVFELELSDPLKDEIWGFGKEVTE